MLQLAGPLACVVGLSIGQILFKLAAKRLNEVGSFWDVRFVLVLGAALGLYAVVSGLWVVILQRTELARAYPVMALSFLFVPIMAWLIFRETVSVPYMLGCALIVGGIVLIGVTQS